MVIENHADLGKRCLRLLCESFRIKQPFLERRKQTSKILYSLFRFCVPSHKMSATKISRPNAKSKTSTAISQSKKPKKSTVETQRPPKKNTPTSKKQKKVEPTSEDEEDEVILRRRPVVVVPFQVLVLSDSKGNMEAAMNSLATSVGLMW